VSALSQSGCVCCPWAIVELRCFLGRKGFSFTHSGISVEEVFGFYYVCFEFDDLFKSSTNDEKCYWISQRPQAVILLSPEVQVMKSAGKCADRMSKINICYFGRRHSYRRSFSNSRVFVEEIFSANQVAIYGFINPCVWIDDVKMAVFWNTPQARHLFYPCI